MSTTIPTTSSTPEPTPRRLPKPAVAALVIATLAGATVLAAFVPLLVGGLMLAWLALDIVRHIARNR